MREYLKYLKGDPIIWIITLLMMGFSLVTVYSFVPILVKIEGGTPFSYLFKHFIYVVLAFVAMYLVHRVNPKYISQLTKFGYYLAIGMLLFTLFFGVEVNGAGRWIRIPFVSLTFQSSDFAKLALLLYVSKLLVRKKDKLDNWKEGIFPIMLPIVVICGLIVKDNFSTAFMLFALSMILLFIGRVPFLKLATMGIAIIGLAGLVLVMHLSLPELNILPRYDTWKNRITNRATSDENNLENAQANNAKLAIHNGHFIGQGVGDGKLKEYLPEAYADFYYASFVEEFGLFFASVLVLTYLILIFRIIKFALATDDLFQSFTSLGIGIHLLSQASINMLVCTGVFPVTGQNMPFLAMGGSALIMACVSIGIIQSFAYQLHKKNKEESTAEAKAEK
jgi:cell division protein FtsW